jgi:glycosyltransferase involved in cell wall biosynthesis
MGCFVIPGDKYYETIVYMVDLPLQLGTTVLNAKCEGEGGGEGEGGDVLFEYSTVFEIQGNLRSNLRAGANDHPSKASAADFQLTTKSTPADSSSVSTRAALVTSAKIGGAELAFLDICRLLSEGGSHSFTVLVFGDRHDEQLITQFRQCAARVIFLDDDFSLALFRYDSRKPQAIEHHTLQQLVTAQRWQDLDPATQLRLEPLRQACAAHPQDVAEMPYTSSPFTEVVQNVFRLVDGEIKFVLHMSNLPAPRERAFARPPQAIVFPSAFVAKHSRVEEFVALSLNCAEGDNMRIGGGKAQCGAWSEQTISLAVHYPTAQQQSQPRTAFPENPTRVFRVGFVGRLSRERMPGAFILAAEAAIAQLADLPQHARAEFYVLGGGPLEDVVVEMVKRMGMQERVVFLGSVPPSELTKVLREIDFDVVVNPCYETFGRATVEAMGAGGIVVGCDGGATPEIIGGQGAGAGLLVDCSDYVNVARGVVAVYSQKFERYEEFLEMKRRAAERSLGLFGAEQFVARRLEGIYRRHDVLDAATSGSGSGSGSGSMDGLIRETTAICLGEDGSLLDCLSAGIRNRDGLCEDGEGGELCASYVMARGCSSRESSQWNCNEVVESSGDHWELNYANGGNSGEGSEGVEARWKASVLNEFLERERIQSSVELGAGDGVTLSYTTKHKSYTGYDVSYTTVKNLRAKYRGAEGREFVHYDGGSLLEELGGRKWEMALSMEVIFHLVEDDVYYRYLENLFGMAEKWVVIMSSNCHEDIRLKGVLAQMRKTGKWSGGTCTDPSAHVRHRAFLSDVLDRMDGWVFVDWQKQAYPELCFSDFYFFKRVAE